MLKKSDKQTVLPKAAMRELSLQQLKEVSGGRKKKPFSWAPWMGGAPAPDYRSVMGGL